MKLSIITVNLNNVQGLKATYVSIAAQTFDDFEWIIIDGGSSDGSKEFIQDLSHGTCKWLSEPDNGIYNAMNKGVHLAEGEWFLFLNSGDYLYEDNTLDAVFANYSSADVLYGNIIAIEKEQNSTHYVEVKYKDNYSFRDFLQYNICHQAILYRRRCFDNLRYDENYKVYSDLLLNMTLSLQDKKFEHLNLFITYFGRDGISTNQAILQSELPRVFDQAALLLIKHGNKSPTPIEELLKRRSCRLIISLAGRIAISLHTLLFRLEEITNKR